MSPPNPGGFRSPGRAAGTPAILARRSPRAHPGGLLIGDPEDPTLGHSVGEDALQTVSDWSCTAVGHVCAADYYLARLGGGAARESRRLARDAYHDDLAA